MPALVLLHAFPLDARMWDREVRALADVASPIVAPSYPGFGRSDPPRSQPSLDDYADAVIAVLDAAGIERAAFAGCSMGGYVAFSLWRRYRARVAGLALVDTRAEADPPAAAEDRRRLAAAVREHGIDAYLRTSPKLLRDASPSWPAITEIIRSQSTEAVAQACVALADRRDSTADLATIDVPTAVIVGEHDTITPLGKSLALRDGIAGATLSVLPDAGHLSNLDAPEAFDVALRAWLRRLP